MTYRPRERLFPVHWSLRVPALAYLVLALSVMLFVAIGQRLDPNTWWYRFVVVADEGRAMGSQMFALLLMLSGVCALIRTSMRGVRIRPDGVEMRDIDFLMPRVHHFKWPQLECIVLDQPTRIALDLWDGSRCLLPRVEDRAGLAAALEKVALARAIPVRGGVGLDELVDSEELGLDPS